MLTLHTLASGSSGNAMLVTDGTTHILLDAGSYTFTYRTTKAYTKIYSVECTVPELTAEPKALAILQKYLPIFRPDHEGDIPWVDDKSNIEELLKSPVLRTPESLIEALDRELRQLTI